jgi:PAS domain S-box-containing protein
MFNTAWSPTAAALSVAAVTLALAMALLLFVLPMERQRRLAEGWVDHTHIVIVATHVLLEDVIDAETGQRGFPLTADPKYLEPIDRAIQTIWRHFDALRALTSDNPSQQARIDALRARISDKLERLRATIKRARAGDQDGALAVVRSDRGKIDMDQIRQAAADIIGEEERLLLARRSELDLRRRDANVVLIALLVLCVLGGCGAAVGWTVARRQSSAANAEIHRMVLALRASEARLQQIFEAAPTAMVMIDQGGDIKMVNARTEQVFGYQRAELLGQGIEMLLPPRFRAGHAEPRDGFFAAPRTRAMGAGRALFGARKDGTEFEMEVGLNAIETDDGKMVVSSVEDVSDRVRLEARLRHSQKMEAIGRLASGVAHDFNNLLQTITASLEIAQDGVEPGTKAHEFAEIGLRSARRGSYLTHHLLAYARQQMLRPRVIDLPALLADFGKLLGRTLGPSIALTIEADPDAPRVRVDPGQIQTALLNLAINASHAMPNGGVLHVESRLTDDDDTGPVVSITVTDNGTGMDAATLAHAAEPFFTTKGLNGTGLGLSMVQGFAEQSGGRMRVRSTLGLGTTVELLLPPVAADIAQAARPPPKPHAPGGGTVLLVDDENDVLATTRAVLERAGFAVVCASGAAEALHKLNEHASIDILVTDFAMPGMNGGELLLEVRRRRSIPAIVITGFADAMDAASVTGDVVTLLKPFERRDLIGAIRDKLHLASVSDSPTDDAVDAVGKTKINA